MRISISLYHCSISPIERTISDWRERSHEKTLTFSFHVRLRTLFSYSSPSCLTIPIMVYHAHARSSKRAFPIPELTPVIMIVFIGEKLSSIPEGFRNMRKKYIVTSFEIRDGTGETEDTEIDSCREIQTFDRFFQKFVGIIPEDTVLLDLCIRHFRVIPVGCARESIPLTHSSSLDSRPKHFRCFSSLSFLEVLHPDTRDIQENIDPIHEGSGEICAIALYRP